MLVAFSLGAILGCGKGPASDGAGGRDASLAPDAAADDQQGGDAPPRTDAPPTGCNVGSAVEVEKTLDVNGIARSYLLVVPDSAVEAMRRGPIPVLVGLHGAGDTPSNFLGGTGLRSLAKTRGLVVIAPKAWNRTWIAQAQDGWPSGAGATSAPNDAALLTAALGATAKDYCVDPKRYFLVGFSRGAGMTAYVVISSGNPDVAKGSLVSPFAAYGINSGNSPFRSFDPMKVSPKRPIWIIHGTADNTVSFGLGKALASELKAGGWPDQVFTPIEGATHNWLWHSTYGHSTTELLDWLLRYPLP